MTVIVLTSGTTWTVPADWSSTNTIEVWGAGAGGSSDNFTSTVSSGGGGGAYNIATNVAGLSGTIQIQIGAAGAGETGSVAATPGGSTWFNGASLATSTVGAVGGSIATGSTTGGAGGLASACHPTTNAVSGGNGGLGNAAGSGAGGGGAAGAGGVGGNGAAAGAGTANGGAGGQGANATGGAGGLGGTVGVGGAGGANQLGGGGGGGAKGVAGAATGGAGGFPGGGGGGGSTDGSASLGGAGAGGQIVITYTPSGGGFTWSQLIDQARQTFTTLAAQQSKGSDAPYVIPPNIPGAWEPTVSFQNPPKLTKQPDGTTKSSTDFYLYDFTTTIGTLPSGVTLSRADAATCATYYNSSGVLSTAAANIPRWDYDLTTLGFKGLLLEGSSTNLLLNSGAQTSHWPTNNAPTVTTNNAGAPDGTSTLNQWTRTTTAASYSQQGIGKASQSIPYSFSIDAKIGTVGNFLALRLQGSYPNRTDVVFNLATGTVGSILNGGSGFAGTATIQALPNGLYRCTLFSPTSDATSNLNVLYSFNSNGSNQVDVTDSVSNSNGFVWGAVLQQGSVTSYIPTVSSTVTRARDVLSFTLPSGVTTLYFAFDDGSIQKISGIPDKNFVVPVENLNRPWVRGIFATTDATTINFPSAWIQAIGQPVKGNAPQLNNALAAPLAPIAASVLTLGWRVDTNYQLSPPLAQNRDGSVSPLFISPQTPLGWRVDTNYQLKPKSAQNFGGSSYVFAPLVLGWRNDANYQTPPKRAQNFGGGIFLYVPPTPFGWRNDANYQLPPKAAQQTGYVASPVAPVIVIIPSAPWVAAYVPPAPLRGEAPVLQELRKTQATLNQVRLSAPTLQQLRKTPPTLT